MYKQITSNCSPQKHFFYKCAYFLPHLFFFIVQYIQTGCKFQCFVFY